MARGSPFLGVGAVFVRASGCPRAHDRGLRGKGPAAQGSRVCGCRRPTAGLRPGSLLAAFIPSFVPGCPRGALGGFAPGRAGSITGAPAPPWGGGRLNGGLAPGRRPGQVMRPARAGEHDGRYGVPNLDTIVCQRPLAAGPQRRLTGDYRLMTIRFPGERSGPHESTIGYPTITLTLAHHRLMDRSTRFFAT